MMKMTTTIQQDFKILSCIKCGVLYAFTEEFNREALRARHEKIFYCPNGHGQWYGGKTEAERIATLEAEKTALQSKLRATEGQRDRAKAEAKRMERRAAGGVCPYCHRSIASDRMQKHIHTKHPEKAHAE
jgi:hypothetical protein